MNIKFIYNWDALAEGFVENAKFKMFILNVLYICTVRYFFKFSYNICSRQLKCDKLFLFVYLFIFDKIFSLGKDCGLG